MQVFGINLDARRKKLYFRSCHRGIKEMDIIFTKFAETVLEDMPDDMLDEYERLLEIPDTDLFTWVTGREAVPKDKNFPLLKDFLNLVQK